MSNKPNILMIMCDQYRGDCFSYKGHPDVLTPNLDTLAQEGTSFDNMYSATPSCVPARATLFTGKKGAKTGFVGYIDGVNWDFDNTLAGLLGQAGYQTECIGKMHVHPSRNRMGFDHVTLHDGYLGYYRNHNLPYCENQEVTDDYLYFLKEALGGSADITETGIDPNAWNVNPWPYEERLHPTNWVTERSLRFLAGRDRQVPFFLMTSYVRPHQPFDAPEKYLRMYEGKSMRPPFVGDWENDDLTIENQYQKDSVFGTSDYETQQRAMKGYYASISHVDSQSAALLWAFRRTGLTKTRLFSS
jgi:arylsulfatase